MNNTDDVLSALEGRPRVGQRVLVRRVGYSKPFPSPKRATITGIKPAHVEVDLDGSLLESMWCMKVDVTPEAAE